MWMEMGFGRKGSVLGSGWVRAGNVGSVTAMASVLPLELQNVRVEHTFSCFMPVNLDCPMDGCESTVLALVFPTRGRRSQ